MKISLTAWVLVATVGFGSWLQGTEEAGRGQVAGLDLRPATYEGYTVSLIRLETEEGRGLLGNGEDLAPLQEAWVPQYKSHCGAASAVVVANSLLPGAGFTQDSIFNPRTAHIIAQETVYRIGFTLEELEAMVRTSSGLKAERFHAGEKEGQHGYEAWIEALKANRGDANNRIICNFATGWFRNGTNTGGHHSPVGDYNEAENKVLIVEVSASRPPFWVCAREMWNAMNQVDSVSGLERGWIVVARR